MQTGRFQGDDGPALALRVDSHWINLTKAFADYERERGQLDPAPLNTVERLLELDGCSRSFHDRIRAYCDHSGRIPAYLIDETPDWLAPVHPSKIVAVGRNYRAHAEELGNAVPEQPILFVKTPNTIVGPGAAIAVDPAWGRVDHEGEVAVLIGKRASRVRLEQAKDHIAGYTLLNDVTARDMQNEAKTKGLPWFCAKNLDTFCPIGPTITFAENFEWPPALELQVTVNDALRQFGNTSQFIFPLGDLVAYISHYITLEAGDLIATGTPQGVGPLKPGDTVTVRCPELGELRNPVVDRTTPGYPNSPRP
ncbi:MAG: fumarylacetoacetate hydrolase family protein [Candidatus Hydrogenedentes bacterium]|nr:fumarylacetoacetate hydrolase family protein [Candidatus Hydrogenedentota bacterium]